MLSNTTELNPSVIETTSAAKSLTRARFIALWLLLGGIAALACCVYWPAAHLGDEYLPVGVDSFYHARRILDTAADPSAFYEFDKKIHAPEGSLLTWPWGYDYALGWIVRIGVALGLSQEPIAILIWIPVAAVFVSVGLMMLLARRLGLSNGLMIVAGLCVAVSPLTSTLHGTGIIDHHFAEYIFVLATLVCGMDWFSKPHDVKSAVILGAVLGIAPAIHNGLFILQLPILVAMALFWLQDIHLPRRTARTFCVALLLATVAILIPSLPVRLGRFEYYTLSWFHLYVAFGTAAVTLLLSYLARTKRNIGLLVLAAAVLLAPLIQQVLMAQTFLTGTIKRLDAISEMRSLRRLSGHNGVGAQYVSTLYSWLIWLLPLAAGYCLWRAWMERATGRLFFWGASLCGLSLLVMQFRLHYFGSFALYLPWLVLIERVIAGHAEHRRPIMFGVALSVLLAHAMPLRYFYFGAPVDPAFDPAFRGLRPILTTLQEACAKDPGIVLADNDAGHYIRYYTQCSVIANNFLLTRQHEKKIELIDHLTGLSAQELRKEAPYVRYLLLRPVSIQPSESGLNYMSYSQAPAPLLTEMLLSPSSEVREGYTLLNQAAMRDPETHNTVPLIRLYKTSPAATTKPSHFGSAE